MEFQFDNIKSDCLVTLGSAQSVVESTLSDATAESVERVLSLSAEVRPLSAEAMNGEALLSGRLNFKLLYLSGGEPRSLDVFADFTERITSEDITPSTKLLPVMQVLDAEVARNGTFKLRAVVESTVNALVKREERVLVGAEETAHLDIEASRLTEHIGSASAELEVSDEEETGGNVSRVLLVDAAAIVTTAKTGENVVFVSGDAEVNVLYVLDGVTTARTFSVPFDGELPLEGASLTDLATARATVTFARVVLAGEENANILRVELRIAVRADAFLVKTQEYSTDAFSLQNELTLTRRSVTVESMLATTTLSDRVSGVATLAEDKPAVRGILGSFSSRNQLASVVAGEGTVTVEGLVTSTILYEDEDGLSSVQVEIPYSSSQEYAAAVPGVRLQIQAVATDVTARAKRDKEIEVSAKITFNLDVFGEQTLEFVSNVEEGDAKPQNDSTLSVYIASEGESIWAAVKALTATPEDIMKQNPSLSLPLAEGAKVFYFRSVK